MRASQLHYKARAVITFRNFKRRGSSAYVKINGAYTKWFDIRRGVGQVCVALPCLFHLAVDSCLYDLKEYECGLRMDELSFKCYLYADDQVILAP
ncbi:hypothetical protein EVAR_10586_1 [Eumeta japonica]|uniref:Reverse transcriptase domain-containing protein n=1 Tax=Eumeta variegata TaxID=151549 RepID=A0A4C1U1T5_EUMVA|nr:hypothetical protein EVAR_10586_1 [Eumeta japonica]